MFGSGWCFDTTACLNALWPFKYIDTYTVYCYRMLVLIEHRSSFLSVKCNFTVPMYPHLSDQKYVKLQK